MVKETMNFIKTVVFGKTIVFVKTEDVNILICNNVKSTLGLLCMLPSFPQFSADEIIL